MQTQRYGFMILSFKKILIISYYKFISFIIKWDNLTSFYHICMCFPSLPIYMTSFFDPIIIPHVLAPIFPMFRAYDLE